MEEKKGIPRSKSSNFLSCIIWLSLDLKPICLKNSGSHPGCHTTVSCCMFLLDMMGGEKDPIKKTMKEKPIEKTMESDVIEAKKYTDSITFEELHCDPFKTRMRTLQLTTWPEGRKREGQLPGCGSSTCATPHHSRHYIPPSQYLISTLYAYKYFFQRRR
ncbi:uncharacterized protein LOC144616562 [Panthera onca]